MNYGVVATYGNATFGVRPNYGVQAYSPPAPPADGNLFVSGMFVSGLMMPGMFVEAA